MRTIFTNSQCVHVWAQQNQDTGKNSNSSIFFTGDTIYSWGNHYPMARIEDGVVFINSDNYSPSTCRHKSLVYESVRHLTVFTVPDVTLATESNYDWMCEQITSIMKKASKARARKGAYLRSAGWLIEDAQKYHELFLSCDEFNYPEIDLDSWKVEQEKKVDKAKSKFLEDFKINRVKWISKAHQSMRKASLVPIVLRLHDATNIITSRGAIFPLRDFLLAYKVIKRLGVNGDVFDPKKHSFKLGSFKIDNVDLEGNITAGCHIVGWDEITDMYFRIFSTEVY